MPAEAGGVMMALHADTFSIRPALLVSVAVRLRLALIASCIVAAAIAYFAGDPTFALRADPALAQLLRGMAALKGLMVLGVLAAVWWRFARPAPALVFAGYVLGAATMAAGAVLIWQLSFIGFTAVTFHVALLGLFLLALKDDGAIQRKTAAP